MDKSLTVIIPCYNEEDDVEQAIRDVLSAVEAEVEDFEVLIFNDGSTDRSPQIIDRLVAANSRLRAIHNPSNMGLGYNYRRGVELASKNYVVMFPGDNAIVAASMREMISRIGQADIILSYMVNPQVRSPLRKLISNLFTEGINLISGCKVRYYNGSVLHRRDVLMKAPMTTNGFAYQAEVLVSLIWQGHTFLEVPMELHSHGHHRSTAFRMKNVIAVLRVIGNIGFKRIRRALGPI